MGPTELLRMISQTLGKVSRQRRGDSRFEGGRTYTVWHVLKLFLLCLLEGFSSGVLYERLERDKRFRRLYGLPNRLISHSQYKKRVKTPCFARALMEMLRQSARGALRALGSEEVRIVAMDLTRLPSDPNRDERGAWGIDSQGYFWGYKLGLVISQSGVILGMTLMKGNWTEFKVNRALVRMAQETIQTSFGTVAVEYLVCDAGFDGESTFQEVHDELKARVVCPRKRKRNPKAKGARYILRHAKKHTPHRFSDEELWASPEAREAFRKRSQIERVNGQLKDSQLRLSEIPRCRRGVRRLFPICLGKLIIYNLAMNVNIAHGHNARSIRHLVA